MKKPYENKKSYDAGRLRHKIQFVEDITVDDGYGGTVVSSEVVLETWAGKEEPSSYTQNTLNAGKTTYSQYQYFIIRNRAGFMPAKDMRIVYDNNKGQGSQEYIIERVYMLDDPCTFLKVLCVVSV